jgi:hypothetical protein
MKVEEWAGKEGIGMEPKKEKVAPGLDDPVQFALRASLVVDSLVHVPIGEGEVRHSDGVLQLTRK